MPFIKQICHRQVVHIGHLDRNPSDLAPSLDGPGISVSIDPDLWRSFSGANAPDIVLENSSALWVDALSFGPDDVREVAAWMVQRNYMKATKLWEVMVFDEATGDFVERAFLDRGDAAMAAGRTLDEEIAAAARGEGSAMEIDSYVLQSRALKRLKRWPDPLRWYDAAILLYVREVVLPKRPLVVGIWWDEATVRDSLAAPRGVLFPEALDSFSIENDEGDLVPFRQAFPDVVIPVRKDSVL